MRAVEDAGQVRKRRQMHAALVQSCPSSGLFSPPYSFSFERVFSRDFRRGMSRHPLGDLDRRLELHEASKDSEQRAAFDQILVQYRKKVGSRLVSMPARPNRTHVGPATI